jgi:raffinose/stachyose/melibiose transport system substrate-binding protein
MMNSFSLLEAVNVRKLVNATKIIALTMIVLLLISACSKSNTSSSTSASNTSNAGSTDNAGNTNEASKGSSDKKVKLKIMFQKGEGSGPDPLYEWMQQNVKLYQEKHPNVTFDVIANASSDNYLTILTTKMAANDLPDIFQGWTLERMRPFAESKRLYDLSDEVKNYPDWQQNISMDSLKTTTFDGHVYGLPLEMAVEPVFYNKKVFKDHGLEIPKTYNEFLNIVDVLKKDGIVPMTVANKEPWVGSIVYETLFERIGGIEAYEKKMVKGEGSWTDEAFVKTGDMLTDLIKRGAFDKNVNSISLEESEIKLAEGKAGMYMQGTWSVPSMINRLGDNIGFFQFPSVEGGKGSSDHYMILPNSALSVGNETKNPTEVIDFLKFVFSQERQLEFAKSGYLTSYKTKTADGNIPKLNQDILTGLSTSTGFMYPWDVTLGVFMGKELNNATQSIFTGVESKKALERLQQAEDSQPKK